MNIIADLHCHTLVSKHALNSITEMSREAVNQGLFAMGITDHGPQSSDGGHPWYFYMLSCQPDVLEGIYVIKGMEANVTSIDGSTDFGIHDADSLDYALASIHSDFFKSLDKESATELWLNVIKNDRIIMAGHPEEKRFEFDYDTVTKEFARRGKVIELNANSLTVRPGNDDNRLRLIKACKKNGTYVCVNSDAHSIYMVAKFAGIPQMLDELEFPPELVINSSEQNLLNFFKMHNPPLYKRMLQYSDAIKEV